MKKFTKNQLLELIILVIIITSIIVITLFIFKISKEKPEKSQSNETRNYSITKTIKYYQNPTLITINNIPLTEYINYNNSIYSINIVSTDNIITNFIEEISLSYNNVPTDIENIIINYCNKYDEIENKYKLKCSFNKSTLTIKNNYNINLINEDLLKTNNKEINIPIKKGTKLNTYLDSLKEKNIEYTEIQNSK